MSLIEVGTAPEGQSAFCMELVWFLLSSHTEFGAEIKTFSSCLPLVTVYFTLLRTLCVPLRVSSSDLHSRVMGRKSCLYFCHDPGFVLHHVSCPLSVPALISPFQYLNKFTSYSVLHTVAHTFNPSTPDTEEGRSLWIQASLIYIVNTYQKEKSN